MSDKDTPIVMDYSRHNSCDFIQNQEKRSITFRVNNNLKELKDNSNPMLLDAKNRYNQTKNHISPEPVVITFKKKSFKMLNNFPIDFDYIFGDKNKETQRNLNKSEKTLKKSNKLEEDKSKKILNNPSSLPKLMDELPDENNKKVFKKLKTLLDFDNKNGKYYIKPKYQSADPGSTNQISSKSSADLFGAKSLMKLPFIVDKSVNVHQIMKKFEFKNEINIEPSPRKNHQDELKGTECSDYINFHNNGKRVFPIRNHPQSIKYFAKKNLIDLVSPRLKRKFNSIYTMLPAITGHNVKLDKKSNRIIQKSNNMDFFTNEAGYSLNVSPIIMNDLDGCSLLKNMEEGDKNLDSIGIKPDGNDNDWIINQINKESNSRLNSSPETNIFIQNNNNNNHKIDKDISFKMNNSYSGNDIKPNLPNHNVNSKNQSEDENPNVIVDIDAIKEIPTPNRTNIRSSTSKNGSATLNSSSLKKIKARDLRKNRSYSNKTLDHSNTKDISSNYLSKLKTYTDWLFKINFSFNIIVNQPTQNTFIQYKYFVGKGNNSSLVKSLMKQRLWWSQAESSKDPKVNLVWTQLNQNAFLGLLKPNKKIICTNEGISNDAIVNEKNKGISQNSNTMDNLTNLETRPNSNKILNISENELDKSDIASTLKAINSKYTSNLIGDIEKLTRYNSNQGPAQFIDRPSTLKMHNHLEKNMHLGSKKGLLYNMRNYFECLNKNVFDHLPLTFHIKNGINDQEFEKFNEYYQSREKEIQENQNKLEESQKQTSQTPTTTTTNIPKNIWIIKPGENTNRGFGITICNDINQIKEIIGSNELHYNGKKKTYIVQQYLDKPLLYHKRKFDIRCYMMITSINGITRGFWYQDGYIRTASKEFTLKNISNKMVHLTNDAVQKKGEEYGKFENGNKLSYTEFQKYLDSIYIDSPVNFICDIYPIMKSLATDAIRSVYDKIDPNKREHTFEIFGLDFMIDQNLKVWLIEINTNPCLELSSPHLAKIIPSMVDNALRISIDPMFPPPDYQLSKKQVLPENLSQNNKFEIVFDEVEDGPFLKKLLKYQHKPNQIYEFEEDDLSSENEEKEEN